MLDVELQAEVIQELGSEPAARQSRVFVRAGDGTVTLAEQVSSFSDKERLEAAVLRVAGIKALDAQISVKRFAVESE